MTKDLEQLLSRLGNAPPDRPLEGVSQAVGERIAETEAVKAQTWGLRAAATCLVAIAGVVASAAAPAVASSEQSPFVAWSTLAPSTLLEMNR